MKLDRSGGRAFELDGIRINEHGPRAGDDFDASALAQHADAAGQLADDLLLNEGLHLGEVDLRRTERDAPLGGFLGLFDELGQMQQRL